MNTTDVVPVNSRSWWEDYFDHSWDVYDGRGQTAYFMRLLVDNLPAAERECLLSQEASILDWGCAFGQGVDALAKAFPRCRAVGMDFAQRAVAEARQCFPQYDFRHTEEGEIGDQFDVIITSNCLEHFADPLSVMRRHLQSCRQFYAILVPYREAPLHPSHVRQFGEEFFPEILDGFIRLTATVIDCGSPYWPGQQLLVIYGAHSHFDRRVGYALQAVQRQLQETRAEVARQAAELHELSVLAEGRKAQLDAIAASRAWALMLALRRVRLRLLPRGGRREAAARTLWRAAGRLRNLQPGRRRRAPIVADGHAGGHQHQAADEKLDCFPAG